MVLINAVEVLMGRTVQYSVQYSVHAVGTWNVAKKQPPLGTINGIQNAIVVL